MANILLQDPMIVFEFIAVILSICYLARLSFGNPGFSNRAIQYSRQRISKSVNLSDNLSGNFLNLFTVGTFISIPKKSLPAQTQLRLLCPR